MKVISKCKRIKVMIDHQSLTLFNLSFLPLILIGTLISCSETKEKNQETLRPNILLLVADDLGYADLGCYGGDIETPNIDNLAAQGVRFSRFHTSPLCAPTRAMLLSGNDNHIAGMGIQSNQNTGFGYEGKLTDRIVTIPALLQANGYHTYMTGKWHLGRDSLSIPFSKGFERSFVNIRGAGNHYDDQGLFKEDPITPYFEDEKPATWNNGDYSTDFYTDKLIEYIDLNKEDKKPFFGFAAYTSPHWPLQVDEKYWKKYEGRYDDGYEKLKERRLESLKNAGMIPKEAVLPPNHEKVIPWDSLSLSEKKKESRKMELYAGMVDNLDYNIGRIIQYLKDIGQFENTLIVFMSDNGAAAEDFYYHENLGPFIREHFNDDYETMGKPNSFISYGPQWAEAGSSPFRHYKEFTTEGGIVAPMIIAGPNIERKNEIHEGFLTLMDIAPTFYEVAQAKYPEKFEENKNYPLKGNSLIPFLSGETNQIHSSEYVFGLEHNNLAMIRKGDWKITNIKRPFLEENFKLYNLSQDLAELHDLKESEPEKYKELLDEWRKFSTEVKVQIPPPSWK
ncbi:arylsulfatase [Urechidicola vernalis]|uniref:Arylsulfatase n=1 Tax=Urechidicola vernalis TaxID=3075600 RepID=A0ABU2Y828_9FLAO|nr:arylsulfatase [Urechidicola sp. P050]MDT0554347.1 arylsulfatase [Urechidicola sp. P050]